MKPNVSQSSNFDTEYFRRLVREAREIENRKNGTKKIKTKPEDTSLDQIIREVRELQKQGKHADATERLIEVLTNKTQPTETMKPVETMKPKSPEPPDDDYEYDDIDDNASEELARNYRNVEKKRKIYNKTHRYSEDPYENEQIKNDLIDDTIKKEKKPHKIDPTSVYVGDSPVLEYAMYQHNKNRQKIYDRQKSGYKGGKYMYSDPMDLAYRSYNKNKQKIYDRQKPYYKGGKYSDMSMSPLDYAMNKHNKGQQKIYDRQKPSYKGGKYNNLDYRTYNEAVNKSGLKPKLFDD